MKRYPIILFALLACLAFAQTQEPLTNASIVKMVKAGLGEDVIVSVVKSQPAKFDLSPDGLIGLKNAGVSDKVMAAMQEKGKSSATTTPPPSGPAADPTAQTPETPAKGSQPDTPRTTSVFSRLGSATKEAVKGSLDRFTGKTVIDKVGLRNILPRYDRSRPLSEQYPHIAVTVLKAPTFWGGSYKSRPSIVNGDCFTLQAVVWTDVQTSKTVGPFKWCQSSDSDFKELGQAYLFSMIPPLTPNEYTGVNRTEGPVPPHTLLPDDRETIERIAANGGDNADPNQDFDSRLAFMFANLRVQFGETLTGNTGGDFRVWIVGINR